MNRIITGILCALLAMPALAGNKSHTSSVTQNVKLQSWTQKCVVKKTNVSTLNSYSGYAWLRYNDPDGETEFVRRNWSVGPGATTFSETSVGLYSITATLTSTAITLTFSATRYGQLYPKYNGLTGALVGYGGTFTCVGAIFVGSDMTGAVVHNIFAEEHVGAWQ